MPNAQANNFIHILQIQPFLGQKVHFTHSLRNVTHTVVSTLPNTLVMTKQNKNYKKSNPYTFKLNLLLVFSWDALLSGGDLASSCVFVFGLYVLFLLIILPPRARNSAIIAWNKNTHGRGMWDVEWASYVMAQLPKYILKNCEQLQYKNTLNVYFIIYNF